MVLLLSDPVVGVVVEAAVEAKNRGLTKAKTEAAIPPAEPQAAAPRQPVNNERRTAARLRAGVVVEVEAVNDRSPRRNMVFRESARRLQRGGVVQIGNLQRNRKKKRRTRNAHKRF